MHIPKVEGLIFIMFHLGLCKLSQVTSPPPCSWEVDIILLEETGEGMSLDSIWVDNDIQACHTRTEKQIHPKVATHQNYI